MLTHRNTWIRADFNGFLEPTLRCLVHAEVVVNEEGQAITLSEGMTITVFDDDAETQTFRPEF